MTTLRLITLMIALSACRAALASDNCRRPMAEWQSREAVTAHAKELGLTTVRLRIDDGCYEIRGRDSDDNRVKLTLDPATLAILKLDVRFRPGADVARYLPGARAQTGQSTTRPAGGPGTPASAAN